MEEQEELFEPLVVQNLLSDLWAKIAGWLADLVRMMPNLIVALIVLLIAVGVGRVLSGWVRAALTRFSRNRQINELICTVVQYAVILAGLFVALGILDLDKTVTSLLAGVGILGLALGFAFQDIAANFMAGVLIAIRFPIENGDIIETNGHRGRVEHVDLRATMLRRLTGELVVIPNKEVFANPMVNYSYYRERRVDLAVGVSYGDDLELVKRVTVEAVSGVPSRSDAHPVELFFEKFGESSIDLLVFFWIPYATERDYLEARSQAVMRIKKAYDEAGVTIPFPIRTLDFGIVGGTRLDEVAPALTGGGRT